MVCQFHSSFERTNILLCWYSCWILLICVSVCVCSCAHTCVSMSMFVCMGASRCLLRHICGGQRTTSGVYHLLTHGLRLGSYPSCVLGSAVCPQVTAGALGFWLPVGSGDPHASTASALPSQQCPAPKGMFYVNWCLFCSFQPFSIAHNSQFMPCWGLNPGSQVCS